MGLPGFIWPRRVQQRQLPQVRIQTRKMYKLHLNHRYMLYRRVL